MIEVITRTVYRSPSKGRCYLTKKAAIKAEARALIEAKHPTEAAEHDYEAGYYYPGWYWTALPRSDVLYRRVCRLIKNKLTSRTG